MKAKKLILFIISLLCVFSLFSQIKIQFADSDEYLRWVECEVSGAPL